ncbi:endoplasmic reticulum membrane-associated RNA degradation protein-like isoform X2 [Lineus longissimus]
MLSSKKPRSFLSPNVYQMLCEIGVTGEDSDERCIQDDHLRFTHIACLLPDAGSDEDAKFYRRYVQSLAAVFKRSKEHLESMTVENFSSKYQHVITWTSCPELIPKCFDNLQSKDGPLTALSLLMLTSILERSLGDVYEMKGNQCPSLLKDLLVTPELREIFGSSVVQLLTIMIGPPISLNIRNVIWHGFAAPNEIPVEYGYFLMMMTVSLGEVLQSKGIRSSDIPHRPFLDFSRAELLKGIFPEDLNLQAVRDIITSSDFIPKTMLPYLSLALEKYENKCYGECLVLVLPQLEHGLRCAFSLYNNCEERVMTAESTTLYTTFDEILSPNLPDGSQNKLLKHLGDQHIQMLYDILMYPEGPRIRDRVSHGEVDLASISRDVARYVIQITVILSIQKIQDNSLLQEPSIRELVHVSSRYKSVFHPLAFLRRQMVENINKLSDWEKLPKPRIEQLPATLDWEVLQSGICDMLEVYKNATAAIVGIASINGDVKRQVLEPFHDSHDTLQSYLGSKSAILYRSQSTIQPTLKTHNSNRQPIRMSELIGLLRRILTNGTQASENVCSVTTLRYNQWEAKELRSRQRNTYKRHLDSVPVLSIGLRLVLLIVLNIYQDLDMWASMERKTQHDHLKLLKSLNQYCENIVSFSSSDKNRWDEACGLTDKIISQVKGFYG